MNRNDYDLSINKYKQTEYVPVEYPPTSEIMADIRELEKQIGVVNQKQMGQLFGVKQATISEHITNILQAGELDDTSIGFSDKSSGGRKPRIYNLDMILSVGYRVNSKRGIEFRKWANSVLKQYIIQGCAVNEHRMRQLGEAVRLMKRIERLWLTK